MQDVAKIPADKLGDGSPVGAEILETEEDLFHDIARTTINKLRENEALGKPTVLILPIGPVGQYPRLARICNVDDISLRNVWCINMDDYLTEDGDLVPLDHPFSFRGYMQRNFLDLLDDDLAPPEEQVVFPDPDDLQKLPRLIDELGGVDICYAGIGINGHIAFNEPPEPGEEMSADEFAELPTRIVRIARETRAVASIKVGGDRKAVPRTAVTIGMKECLSARELRIYAYRPWHPAVIRGLLHGPVTAKLPCSLAQTHDNATLLMTEAVADGGE